jgi:hypothetical protein
MPTSPFGQVNPGNRRAMVGDASEFTRFVRMASTIGPYAAQNQSARPNSLGWRDMGASRDARVFGPILGTFKSFIPNR